MTAKCCRDCASISKDGGKCLFLGFYFPRNLTKRAGILNPDTFYCAAFTRRNSAKPVSIPIEYGRDIDGEIVGYKDSAKVSAKPEVEDNCECSEDFTDGTPFCQQCGKKRVVIPPIQRRFT